jgi:endo-beta-N-acetylglucosaminidase D
MFYWKSLKVSETQIELIDQWILSHKHMRTFIASMEESREERAKLAYNEAMLMSRKRVLEENLRIKELDLQRENACLRLAADALVKNIQRHNIENERNYFDPTNPQWMLTNFWRVKIL